MARLLAAALIVVLVAAGAAYLWLYQPQREALAAALARTGEQERELARTRARVADLEAVRQDLQRTSTELQQRIAEKEKELEALRATQDELVAGLKQEIADKQVQVERIQDRLRVEMVDEVLFGSGESTIKPAGLEVLRRVGAILKKVENRRIEVQGHTDNVPITSALLKRFPTNWELSAARATNVVRFLQDGAKLDPAKLSAAAFAEYAPRAPNDTPQGRRKNRRIEILLGPVLHAEQAAAAQ
jgi:chemotaxis protein MotB